MLTVIVLEQDRTGTTTLFQYHQVYPWIKTNFLFFLDTFNHTEFCILMPEVHKIFFVHFKMNLSKPLPRTSSSSYIKCSNKVALTSNTVRLNLHKDASASTRFAQPDQAKLMPNTIKGAIRWVAGVQRKVDRGRKCFWCSTLRQAVTQRGHSSFWGSEESSGPNSCQRKTQYSRR